LDEEQSAFEIRTIIELLEPVNQLLLFKIIQLLGNTCDSLKETILYAEFKKVLTICCSLWVTNIVGSSKYQSNILDKYR
jgi:hypothetical protein